MIEFNPYDEYTLDQLQKCEQQLRRTITQYECMVGFQGGWMFWNGDKEDEARKDLQMVLIEIRKRKAKN